MIAELDGGCGRLSQILLNRLLMEWYGPYTLMLHLETMTDFKRTSGLMMVWESNMIIAHHIGCSVWKHSLQSKHKVTKLA